MTQRIFDTDNAEDMADLWDILPDGITKLTPTDTFCITSDTYTFKMDIIKINWHDKTEIVRPLPEATEKDIGKICKFWNDNIEDCRIAIFICILDKFNYQFNFCDNTDTYWKHCRRLTKQEIEELC